MNDGFSLKQTTSRDVDTLVIGGGMAGVAAAISASRAGAKTLLIDRYGFLGGTATAALVGCICGLYTCGEDANNVQVVFGCAEELKERLEKVGAGFKFKHRYQMDHEVLKIILDEWCEEAGVETLFHTEFLATEVHGGKISRVIVGNKGGLFFIVPKIIIDATGDGDVAFRAGVPFEKGDGKGNIQSSTYIFYVGGVDFEKAFSISEPQLMEMQKDALEKGKYDFPRTSGSYSPSTHKNTVHVNMTRIKGIDATNPLSLSEGQRLGRKQIWMYFDFLKKMVPGFEEAYISAIAPQLGIRESRRIMGHYYLTGKDILEGRKFPDAICRGTWPIEEHTDALNTVRIHLPGDEYYQIPYGCLLPQGISNLLLAGRCISTSREAHHSVRVMASGIATGQAAGIAAFLSLQASCSPGDLSPEKLKEALITQGVLI